MNKEINNCPRKQVLLDLNKAINEWVRRQLHGKNQTQEGDEESTIRVDDLQVLLKPSSLNSRNKGLFNQTDKLPIDYLHYKRVTPVVNKGKCSKIRIKSHLREEANVDDLNLLPSFKFEETFHTLMGNRINIYHNKDFNIDKVDIIYYKKPKVYEFSKPRLNDNIEFKEDVCELLVDDACTIISSDLQDLNAKAILEARAEKNN